MFKTLFAEETEETRRLLGSMATEPVKEAVDPAREADNAPPTVLHGTLTVEVPGGETMVLKTTFDSGSNTDAVSEKVAMQLKKLGVPWGEAGGGVSMAVSSSVAVPHGELRLLLSAEPTGRDGREEEQLAIPRPLQFVTDALIMKDLSTDLIIGWPTLKGTGLLAIVLGLEEYELEEDKDDDGLGELWEASEDPTYGPPTVKGSAEEVQKLRTLCEEFKHLFGPPPSGGCKLPPIDIELKKDSDGRYMEPKRLQARYVSPWINELIREDTAVFAGTDWDRKTSVSPFQSTNKRNRGEEHRRNFEALAVYSQRKTNQNRLEPLLADGPTNPKCRENRRNRSKPGKHLYARPGS